MSALHPSIDPARASAGAESLAPQRGAKKKGDASSGAEGLFAAILAKAGEALRPAQAALKAASADHGEKLGAAARKARVDGPGAAHSRPASGGPASRGAPRADASAADRAAAAPQAGAAAAKAAQVAKAGLPGEAAAASGQRGSKAGARSSSPDARPDSSMNEESASFRAAKSFARAIDAQGQPGAAPASREGAAQDRRSAEPKVGVVDLRRSRLARVEGQPSARAPEAEGPAREEPASPRRELVRELGIASPQPGERDARGGRIEAPARSAAGTDFSSLLAQRLRETGNGEIVQAAHIVLKDGDSGTIRLKLRPESLGEVKIELNLSDKSISGKIVVESDEAKSAFEREMASLSDAFKQGGFESASLEVSVGSGSKRDAGGEGGRDAGPFFSERLRAADSVAGPAAAGAYARRGEAVDILA